MQLSQYTLIATKVEIVDSENMQLHTEVFFGPKVPYLDHIALVRTNLLLLPQKSPSFREVNPHKNIQKRCKNEKNSIFFTSWKSKN